MPTSALLHALYPGSDRGLASALFAARALKLDASPVATGLVMADPGVVTDVTEVPGDTVASQLEHLDAVHGIGSMLIGAVGSVRGVEVVFDAAEALQGPVVLDLRASGPAGETLIPARGLDAMADRLGVPDLVLLNRTDAELVTGGEIRSLDDAQVAAQRARNQGARRVLIKCGNLPDRFLDAHDEPSTTHPLASDLYYDGEEFALFEAPWLETSASGMGAAHAVALLAALVSGTDFEVALQQAKRYVTEALRPQDSGVPVSRLDYGWNDLAAQ